MAKCEVCGRKPVCVETRYGKRYSCCGNWSWGDGPLVDEATHEARKSAHLAFDTLWKSKEFTRSAAYRALAKELGIPQEDCHIKKMGLHTALKVPSVALKIRYAKELLL